MRLQRALTVLAAGAAGFALLSAIPAVAAAQSGTVTGTVMAQDTQQPLGGVQIVVDGTQIGALSGQDGTFTLRGVPAGEQEIRASRLGYARGTVSVVVPADGSVAANFNLRQTAVELEGVTVSAVTGRQERRRELGTNTASIRLEDINPARVMKLQDVLTARAPGVTLQQASGTIGTAERIRIRGANSLSLSNEPLIYIDGIRAGGTGATAATLEGLGVGGQRPSRLNDLNPNDIENVEILKGPAATAMYGTAGANGVILITTKRGQSGAARWNVYSELTDMRDVTQYPANYVAYSVNEDGDPDAHLYIYQGTPGIFNYDHFTPCTNRAAAAGLCEQQHVASFNTLMDPRTRPFQTGNRHRWGANVAGGADDLTYYISGDIEEQQGIVQHNHMSGGTFRANLQARLSETVTANVNTGYVTSKLSLNNNDNSIFSPLINGLLGTPAYIDYEAEFGEPAAPTQNENYGWGFSPGDLAEFPTVQDVDRLTAGTRLGYTPLQWLSTNLNLGIDWISRHTYNHLEPRVLPIGGGYDIGFRQSERSDQFLWTAGLSGTAAFELTPHIRSTTTVGTQYERSLFEETYCYGEGLIVGTRSCGATSENFTVDEAFEEIITVGGFIQQQFAFGDRFFLSGSLRADDDSAFGDQFDLAWFPGLSASWVASEEAWFPGGDVLSELRLRAAYGTSGLRPSFRQAVTLLDPVAVTIDGGETSGVTIGGTGNPLLSPERTTEHELGFDAGLFRDRLGLEFTYFTKTSRDALIARRLAPSLGVSQVVFDNLGSVRNRGTELAARLTALETRNVGVNLIASHSTTDNKILSMAGEEAIVFNRGHQRHEEGFPAGAFFQPPVEWDIPEDGGPLSVDHVWRAIERDADGQPILDAEGNVILRGPEYIGPALPTWTVTFGGDVSLWRLVTVGTLFEGRGGNYMQNMTAQFRCGTGNNWGQFGLPRGCAAVWDPEASYEEQAAFIATLPITAGGAASNALYIERADFLKWREVSVAVGAPPRLASISPLLAGASLTVAARNLATWTDYTGLDPEVQEGGGIANFSTNEFNTQPPLRHVSVRLNFAF